MSKYRNNRELHEAIADEVRAKTGSSEGIKVEDLPAAVKALPSGNVDGKVIDIVVGVATYDISGVGEFGFAVRIDKPTINNPFCFFSWNSVDRTDFAKTVASSIYNSANGVDTNTNANYLKYDKTTHTITIPVSGTQANRFKGKWLLLPYYISAQ